MWQDLKYDNVCFKPPAVYPTVFSPWNFFLSPRSLSCAWYFTSLKSIALSRSVSSVTQSCLTLCDPMNCSTPGLPILESTQTHVIESVMPSNHLTLCHFLLLLLSIFPNIRVFLSESALRIRWPKYWSYSFNISPFSEHPGLISFMMDWLDLLAVLIIIHFCILRDLFGNSLAETLK